MPPTVRHIELRKPRGKVRVAIVVSRYNNEITDRMRDGAIDELSKQVGDRGEAVVIPAPGSFELPYLAAVAAVSGKFDAIVALGCLIKGETSHDRIIADAIAPQLAEVAVQSTIPVAFGVLTVDTDAQAEARAGGSMGNKGNEAMAAALDCLAARRALLND